MVKETRTANTVWEGIENMIETMTRDFARDDPDGRSAGDNYRRDFEVNTGRKYAKVLNRDSVKAFVVLTDTDEKFRLGDILKPAGYSTPARNSARGNVLDGGYHINWTGPLYLT